MENLLIIFFRTLLMYFAILIIFRLMGKREIGELSVLDLVVFIMIGEMAVVAIENHSEPVVNTLLPMVVLLGIQIALALFSLHSNRFRKLIDGKPSILISKGKIDEKEMRKQRYNFDDLLMQLRSKDIDNIADVEFAILETSGELSVVKKSKNKNKPASYTEPLIVGGKIQQNNLKKSNKTEAWLRSELQKRGYGDISRISFCSYQDGEFYIDLDDVQ
ncbi:DUF421 domain-containing protein [Heyndrickxia coagulans]|uniref:Uncharacterized membrane protein YcaP, DUF421 family n=1 Tax=Heyndrickxia coagulans DSM 1 = ATCC 7050 TaxID=1121088 RepID=A0A8B4BSN2_HEYCO|nr:DUF421 domain-containing protein [Heyndrickxia coagulans]AJH79548.1 hypothetical protein BF29_906 [Heyndrickxia coagulans DSM 1 = ATCC 7050]MCR2846761.1 DUF421 domain-containing protein [Heyndrickxia coagulans]MDR4223978.1 DUF421 domain-containing protein [Heyndrickxia coagulans DSM 1 = ATCC 7050]MEC5267898.1 DUF421 domain-containing protein [Heyndrickxia coagulans]MED4405403.1 DUF421 domain-containing protein [Heyndrickxia coagulans]